MTPDNTAALDYPPIKRERMTTPAIGSAQRWHYLSDRTRRGVRYALCGEGHRKWWPLARWRNAEVFEPCQECADIHRVSNKLRAMASDGTLEAMADAKS